MVNISPFASSKYDIATDRTTSQMFHRMYKCEASGWRFHSTPNVVMRGSPVTGSLTFIYTVKYLARCSICVFCGSTFCSR